MPQAALALRAAFSVQKSSDKGRIFSSPKQLQRRNFLFWEQNFRLKKQPQRLYFRFKKSNPGGGFYGSKKQR